MYNELKDLLPTIIGGAIALLASFGATWFAKFLEVRNQSKQLALAIKGELQAIVHILSLRQYSTGLRSAAIQMQKEGVPLLSFISIEQDYTQIFKSNCSKIGILGNGLPTDVAIVYTQISALLDDISFLNACSLKQQESTVYRPGVEDLIPRFKSIADLLDDTTQKAKKVCTDIDLTYPK